MPGKYMNRSLILNQAQSSCMKIPLLTGYPWITLPDCLKGVKEEVKRLQLVAPRHIFSILVLWLEDLGTVKC